MRQKLRHRAKTLMEKSRGETKLTKRLQRKLSTQRLHDSTDHDVGEQRVARALQQSTSLRQKIARQTPASGTAKLVSPSEQYDFFAKVFPTDSSRARRRRPATTERSAGAAEEEPGSDRSKTASDAEEAGKLTRDFVKASVKSYFAQLKDETKIYYYPPTNPVPLATKLSGEQPRRASAEGLYTPAPIQATAASTNRWEHRYIDGPQTQSSWFDEAGRIRTELSGLAPFPMRVELDERPEMRRFCKATQGRRVQVDAQYQLDIDLSRLVFVHHPLFSAEHVLAAELCLQYRLYTDRRHKQEAEKYDLQLRAEQLAIERYLDVAEAPDNNGQLRLMRQRLKHLRGERNRALAAEHSLVKSLIESWSRIEKLRADQKYTATPYQLLLTKDSQAEVDTDVDRASWEQDMLDELFELEDEYYAEAERKQPNVGVAEFSTELVWQQLVQGALTSRRKPGEPQYTAVLGTGATVTPIEDCPAPEQQRRRAAAKCKYSLRVCFNGLDAASTPDKLLNVDDFSVTFGQIHTLHVHEMPQQINIKIFEKGLSASGESEQVAVLGLAIPEPHQVTTEGTSFIEEYQFGCDAVHRFEHAAVGAGVDVVADPQQPASCLYTTGILQAAASWARDAHGTPLAPPTSEQQPKADERPAEVQAALRELQQLYSSSTFDINDPVNAHIAAMLNHTDLRAIKQHKTSITDATQDAPATGQPAHPADDSDSPVFRTLLPELELMTDDEFYADVRFKLFEMRRTNVPEFRNIKMAPAYAAHVDPELFERYQQRVEKEKETERITGLDSLRAAGHKFAAHIKQQVQLQSRFVEGETGKAYEDVVRETPLPDFVFSLSAWCQAQPDERPLRPVRKTDRRGSAIAAVPGRAVKLLVNIQHAANIPTRAAAAGLPADEKNEVEPFFEVRFQDVTRRSSVVVGPNATWQQLIQFDFMPPNDDYSPDSLKTVTDVLSLNLFDQVVTKLPKDDREGVNTVREQIEKRWLGCVRLPFSTLYFNAKIDGSLRIRVPPLFLGYKLHRDDQGRVNHPYVKLLLAMEPPLPLPEPPHVKLDTVETEQMQRQCEQWTAYAQGHHPKRRYVALVLDTHGRSLLVCRFLTPIEPPAQLNALTGEPKKAASLAVHIVSMIPFVADAVQYPGLCDIWSTADEFLLMLCGDEEEHALLMCCWLMQLSLDCYLVLGNGLPEGPRSAYVLVKFGDGTLRLYNAADGQEYDVTDAYCPLTTVGTLVTKQNVSDLIRREIAGREIADCGKVWANMQQHAHPSRMSFDVSNTHNWRPLLKRQPENALDSVQPSRLVYTPTDASSVQELRAHIEREIKLHFDQWRPHGIPQWDFDVSRTLRDMLPEFEAGTLTPEAHSERLHAKLSAHKTMTGFPLNMPYESVDKVLDAVKATNVHVNFDAGVEFALGVYLHAYDNNILSLWVYIASLSKRYT